VMDSGLPLAEGVLLWSGFVRMERQSIYSRIDCPAVNLDVLCGVSICFTEVLSYKRLSSICSAARHD